MLKQLVAGIGIYSSTMRLTFFFLCACLRPTFSIIMNVSPSLSQFMKDKLKYFLINCISVNKTKYISELYKKFGYSVN